MVFLPPPNTWQMMILQSHLDALITKLPFSFFAAFWVRVTSGARGSVSVGIRGARQLRPFWGGGSNQSGCIDPPSTPETKARPPV